ncbi:hypothetical protein [Rahnella aquatilis]|uniref:hypothetical protein n=1 Tax=Rahnella aquatilis TaxID=34038 RepID=UPI00365656ED
MTDTTDIAAQPKMTLEDLLSRCTDYDDMSLSMDASELRMLKQHISLLETELRQTDLFKFAFDEWLEKTDWVQARKKFPFQHLGMHRADVMTTYIEHLEADNAALKTKLANPVVLPHVTTERAGWTTWQWIEHLGGRYQNGNSGDYVEFGSVFAVQQMLKQFGRTMMAQTIPLCSEAIQEAGFTVKGE